jgi:deazaflavin-dependent oxidoreductase (nitroreductase family)
VAAPFFLRAASAVHGGLYRLTRGRLGRRIGKAPVLLLTTTGRRSGARRTVPLLFLEDGDGWVVVASNGGRPEDPGWWRNLSAAGVAEVQVGGRRAAVVASETGPAEREQLWPRLTAIYPAYDSYREKTSRTIPVVRLRPKG